LEEETEGRGFYFRKIFVIARVNAGAVYKVLTVISLSANSIPKPTVSGLKSEIYWRKLSMFLTDFFIYRTRQNEQNTTTAIFP
jgi:hypothetical protein